MLHEYVTVVFTPQEINCHCKMLELSMQTFDLLTPLYTEYNVYYSYRVSQEIVVTFGTNVYPDLKVLIPLNDCQTST